MLFWTVKFHSFVVGIQNVLSTTMKGGFKLKLYSDIFYYAEHEFKRVSCSSAVSSEICQIIGEYKLSRLACKDEISLFRNELMF